MSTAQAMREAHTAAQAAETRLAHTVVQARANGASWAEVGEALGCSKQTAYNRYKDAAQRLRTASAAPLFQEPGPLPGQTSIEDAPAGTSGIDGEQFDAGTINTQGHPVNWHPRSFAPVCKACGQHSHYTQTPTARFWFESGCVPTQDDYLNRAGLPRKAGQS